jgi:hypothetical protein
MGVYSYQLSAISNPFFLTPTRSMGTAFWRAAPRLALRDEWNPV